MKIHVGCGKRDFGHDWVHVDGAKYPHVQHEDVILKSYKSDIADVIYSSHIFEYWDREEGLSVLQGWYRVLRPGGILRLAVPDWDNMMIALSYNDFNLKDILGPLYGKMKMGDQTIYHKTVYNYPDLRDLLRVAGFKEARRYDWRQTDHAQFDDHSQAYLPKMDKDHGILISLNVEAIK